MKSAKEIAERAEQLFYGGHNCAETAAMAVVEGMGAQCSCLPALATGLGGGVGHTGNVCGAVLGGAMAIGVAAGRKGFDNHNAEKAWANKVVAELVEAFKQQFSEVECRELIHIDFRQNGWMEKYKSGGCKSRCGGFVRFVSEWTAERLSREEL